MDSSDSLGDLAAVMGDDYGHGFDDSDGDPNVKPKKPPAPKMSQASADTIKVKFPAQKQFLTKLVVQCIPIASHPGYGEHLRGGKVTNWFDNFSTASSVGGMIVQPKDPTEAKSATFKQLTPGFGYSFRLVVTNPSGTVTGKASEPIWCYPKIPPAPKIGYATARSIEIKFPCMGVFGAPITGLGIEMAVYTKNAFGPENKKKGLLEDRSPLIQTRTTGLIRNLKPGQAYVFRLIVENKAGKVVGPSSKALRTLPKPPLAPREDSKQRTDSSIALKWTPHGKSIKKLTLQCVPLNGRKSFENITKSGGKEIDLTPPDSITEYTCTGLQSDLNYVFRLIAENSSGKTIGHIAGPVKTVTYTPEMLDKSGWLVELPSDGKKTLGRRLSLKKNVSSRYWYTIDGKLLTWAKGIDGEEVDFVHLGKVKQVNHAGNILEIVLNVPAGSGPKAKPKKLCLMCESDNPNMSNEELAASWVKAIEDAILGKPEDAQVAEVEAAEDEAMVGHAQDGADDEEAGGFELIAGADEEEAGGFGLDEDEDEEGATGFSDDEDEAGGFGASGGDEEDEEEATGFGSE